MSKTNLPRTLFGSDSHFKNCWTPCLYYFLFVCNFQFILLFLQLLILKYNNCMFMYLPWQIKSLELSTKHWHAHACISLFLHAHTGGQSQKSCGRDGRPTLGEQSWILLFWNICPDWRWDQWHVSGKSMNFICKYICCDWSRMNLLSDFV